jgi:hypothetical protein
MNDSELITAVQESVADVHTATPVDQIVHRGRALRSRRRLPRVAAVVAVAAGAALAANALVPSGQHPVSSQPPAQLAAWTVVKQADGNVYVTIRQFRDPAGLQARLRADGVPASVTFAGQQNPACQPYPYRPGLLQTVVSVRQERQGPLTIIHLSALPTGAGLRFVSAIEHQGAGENVGLDLVQASPRCTGS